MYLCESSALGKPPIIMSLTYCSFWHKCFCCSVHA
uniref:Uncharacterized protein n=1 Tax=Arundo donax TaxID=35708 RepID=A0A0A9AUT2_ARUDO